MSDDLKIPEEALEAVGAALLQEGLVSLGPEDRSHSVEAVARSFLSACPPGWLLTKALTNAEIRMARSSMALVPPVPEDAVYESVLSKLRSAAALLSDRVSS